MQRGGGAKRGPEFYNINQLTRSGGMRRACGDGTKRAGGQASCLSARPALVKIDSVKREIEIGLDDWKAFTAIGFRPSERTCLGANLGIHTA
jgi:hypothetical protein